MDPYDDKSRYPEPEPSPDPGGAPEPHPAPGPHPRTGIAGLSRPYQAVAAAGLAVIGVLACVHLGMVFLYIAPANTITKQHGDAVNAWVLPEFEQNWKLFAPNPLQQNVSIQVRAEVDRPGGGATTTDWIDLSAQDGAAIHGNPLPSHVDQNELRRAWDFFTGSHNNDNRPVGERGQLSESYLHRLVMLRLNGHHPSGQVTRVQLRSATSTLPAPPWSDEKINTQPYYRVLPWWTVTASDLPGGVRNGSMEVAG
ncbi:membrane protein [Streptomyces sp. 150FB]|uniref:DUF5819 family protein n=1 Tax=Streptomyces sp. 150FB TaxID=1576605 RepID=UPI000589639D|nr:DUF5819 family protein [Streptomyces sp. 150FB]KIF75564.1 membrane protein [Streptomyces sp. 150FB]